MERKHSNANNECEVRKNVEEADVGFSGNTAVFCSWVGYSGTGP
jgi:hypothetical protein